MYVHSALNFVDNTIYVYMYIYTHIYIQYKSFLSRKELIETETAIYIYIICIYGSLQKVGIRSKKTCTAFSTKF